MYSLLIFIFSIADCAFVAPAGIFGRGVGLMARDRGRPSLWDSPARHLKTVQEAHDHGTDASHRFSGGPFSHTHGLRFPGKVQRPEARPRPIRGAAWTGTD